MQAITTPDTPEIHTMSNHPVHIGYGQNSSPSAFIPFCSFCGNISIMGENIPNFGIPVCNKFKPRILKGRLCYQVDVNEFKDEVDSDKLRTHGLVFMMDYNEERIGLDTNIEIQTAVSKDFVDMREKDMKKEEAMIYIETLGKQNYVTNALYFPPYSILIKISPGGLRANPWWGSQV